MTNNLESTIEIHTIIHGGESVVISKRSWQTWFDSVFKPDRDTRLDATDQTQVRPLDNAMLPVQNCGSGIKHIGTVACSGWPGNVTGLIDHSESFLADENRIGMHINSIKFPAEPRDPSRALIQTQR